MGTSGGETLVAAHVHVSGATVAGEDGADGADGDEPVVEPNRPRLDERRLFLVAVAVAALPFVVTAVALIAGVGSRYLPAGDLAMTEMHVRDIGHHQVLTGLYSRIDWSHPGPLQFYLVAPFYWLTGRSSLGVVLGALALNLASIVGILAVARRRGGAPLLLCSLVASLLLTRTLGPEYLGDAWNLTLTLLPFVLLVFLVWSLGVGETWALPVAAFVTSFLVQTHVGFLVLAVPLFAAGAVVLARRTGRGCVRAALITAGVLAVVWLPTVMDMVMHQPSNLTRAYDYFRDPGDAGHSLAEGWRVATGQFGTMPEWLTGKLPPGFTGESPFLHTSPLPVLLLVVAAAAVVVWRRGRHGPGLVLTWLAALAAVVLSIVQTAGPVQDYRLRYTWAPPAVAAVIVLWGGWLALTRWRPGAGRVLVPAALALAVALSGLNAVTGARAGVPHDDDVEVVSALSAPVIDLAREVDGPVVVTDLGSIAGPWYSRAIVLQLERRGLDVKVDRDVRYWFTPTRQYWGGRVGARVIVASDGHVGSLVGVDGLTLLARWQPIPGVLEVLAQGVLDDAFTSHDAGRLSDGDLMRVATVVGAARSGDRPRTTTTDVAVFLDERAPGSPLPPPDRDG